MRGQIPARLGAVLSPAEPLPSGPAPRRIAVIDVLRATSSIPTALAAGAEAVVPLATVEEARRLASGPSPDPVLLCGERDGVPLPGFDLGNSPAEYTRGRVAGRTLLYCSTNGSGAAVRWRDAGELIALSFLNLTAGVEHLAGGSGDVLLVCAGQGGRASLEDTALAGCAVSRLRELRPDLVPDDGAMMAERVWGSFNNDALGMLRASQHGRYLMSLGFGEDLVLCAAVDSVPVVPFLAGDRFRLTGR